jgi:hypothetical protein
MRDPPFLASGRPGSIDWGGDSEVLERRPTVRRSLLDADATTAITQHRLGEKGTVVKRSGIGGGSGVPFDSFALALALAEDRRVISS